VRRVKITLTQRMLFKKDNAAIGIGTLIIFIAMILVAGMTASILIETMNNLEQTALKSGQDAVKDISSGLKVTHISGFNNGSVIDQIAIFIELIAGSDVIDLTETYISITDTSKEVILNYSTSVFSTSVSNGLFGTVNSSWLTATQYGIMVVRDIDSSCTSTSPVINDEDLLVILVNTSQCFSGIGTRTEVSGNIVPEQGISGIISFTTPSTYIDTIIDLQN
jgi:flagellin FlaB